MIPESYNGNLCFEDGDDALIIPVYLRHRLTRREHGYRAFLLRKYFPGKHDEPLSTREPVREKVTLIVQDHVPLSGDFEHLYSENRPAFYRMMRDLKRFVPTNEDEHRTVAYARTELQKIVDRRISCNYE